MRKIFRLLTSFIFLLLGHLTYAQNVGIGTNTPHSSARLEISSTSSGLLFPRLTGVQRDAIQNPVAGLAIFCTNCGERGEMQYYDGIGWVSMKMGSAANPVLANVVTAVISGITANAAVSGGDVSVTGGSPVTSRGVVWGTISNPTVELSTKTTDGSGTGSFTSNITNLTPNTLYYVRAYAVNTAGITYGNELTFTSALPEAIIGGLNCAGATNNGTLSSGIPASVISEVPYTGGNGGIYTTQSINSTGVTGLTATLPAGTLSNGSGSLSYIIAGTPLTSGTASFALSFGGQTCTLTRTVNLLPSGITAHTCGAPNVHNPDVNYGTMTDQEGNEYKTVQIGSQTWMAENLKTTKFRNGEPISHITDDYQWATTSDSETAAYCSFNNDASNDCPYGKLYNFYAVKNSNQLCPTGWHVPSDAEWNILIANLDPSYNPAIIGVQSTIAGGKLKSTGVQYWTSPNTGATNSSGFSALPGGRRGDGGIFYGGIGNNSFGSIGEAATWYTSVRGNIWDAYRRNVSYNSADIIRDLSFIVNYGYLSHGRSVRCLKD